VRTLKILQVSDAYYPFPGGVSEHLHYLSLHLRRRGHSVTILTGGYDDMKEENVVRVGRVILTPPLFLFNLTELTITFSKKLPIEVRDFLRKNHFDIVHTHGPLAVNLPHLALHYSNSINVATFHTAFVGFNFHKIGRFFFYRDAKKIDAYIFVSEVAKRSLFPYYKGNFYLVPNGIDTERFNPNVPLNEKIKDMGKPIILYVGRLEPRKGLPHLIDAFPYLLERYPDSFLVVVGRGPFEKKYRELALIKGKGRIHFQGYVSPKELPSFYRTADLYTSPAVGGETFGIVLLEAMASGTPVVASNISGYRGVIKDGENGIIVDVRNPEEYAQGIIKVLESKTLRDKLIERGLDTAKRHDWKNISAEIERIYFELLGK
jgi:phosphatidylinositol alpha-mannosyltransferase